MKANTGGGREDICDHGCDHDLVPKVAEGKAYQVLPVELESKSDEYKKRHEEKAGSPPPYNSLVRLHTKLKRRAD